MDSINLDDDYWSDRYQHQNTGWDLHEVSPPLKSYIDQWTEKESRILIPGCGNAYEAEYLLNKGFTNITLVDISSSLVKQLQAHFSGSPIRVTHANFFEHEGRYDLVLEQTFFCALDPGLRKAYAVKMYELLAPGGKLSGVLFNRNFDGGPPFGGSIEEYRNLFSRLFEIQTLEPCYNSIAPRTGSEVFFILKKL